MDTPPLSRDDLRDLVRSELRGMLQNGADVIHVVGYPWGKFELVPMKGAEEISYSLVQLDQLAEILREEAARV